MLALEGWSAAARMTDPACRSTMEELAVRYDRLADHLEQRSAEQETLRQPPRARSPGILP
jgi:hypothetical protein